MYELLINLSIGIMVLAIMLSFVRILIGKGTINRVVAFDTIGFIAISLIVLISHLSNRIIYLDVALVYGLLSFLGVIAVARYIERGL